MHRRRPMEALVRARPQLVFIGGAGLSEGQEIARALDAHPSVERIPSFVPVADIVAVRNKMQDSVSRGWIDMICSDEDVDLKLRALFEGLLSGCKSAVLCCELSRGSRQFFDLAKILPSARFIRVVRDPRESALELLESSGERPAFSLRYPQIEQLIEHLRRSFEDDPRVLRGEETGEQSVTVARGRKDRLLTVQALDLIRDRDEQMKRICAFLDIDFPDSMRRPADDEDVEVPELRWPKSLSAADQMAIAKGLCGQPVLTGLGFDLSPASLSPAVRTIGALTSMLMRVSYQLRTRVRSLRRKWESLRLSGS